MSVQVLVVDNYDSFTFNLAQACGTLGADVRVVRSDCFDPKAMASAPPGALIISPGPGRPENAGRSLELVKTLSGRIPILGVCLGHQAIGVAFGGRIVAAAAVMHGKTSRMRHNGGCLFAGVPSPFVATRYHSLVIEESSISGSPLEVTARTYDGVLMAIEHREHPTFGVQFHPESVLTSFGPRLVKNFLTIAEQYV